MTAAEPTESELNGAIERALAAEGIDAMRTLVGLLTDGHLRYPERLAREWIPAAERVILAGPNDYQCPVPWLLERAPKPERFPLLRLFKQAVIQGGYEAPDTVRAIFANPDLCNLDVIFWTDAYLRDEGLAALLDGLVAPRLRVLDVQNNQIGNAGARAIADSDKLGALTHLCLFRNDLRDAGIHAVMQSAKLPALQMLSVGYQNALSNRALAEAIAAAPSLGRLRELRVEHSDLDDEDAARIADAPGLRGLGALFLTGNPLSDKGMVALRESPHLAGTRLLR